MRSRLFSSLLFLLLLAALPAAPADAALAKRGGEVSTADACNPHPDKDDIVLPMPGGLSMAFRLVAVPSKGLLWDMSARPGRDDAANSDRAFYDRRYRAFLSAPFSRADLPAQWRAQAPAGDYFFYLVAKYEVSRLQWQSIMGNGTGEPVADAARPVTDISWYEAVEFTRRYTEWLLQNAADALPHYAGDSRNVGFVRLPTETEWEYAARGGQTAGPEQLMEKDFFALPAGAPLADYAVYRPEGAARIAEDCARIGSRKANPLGLYDTAGNAAEMALDMFRFSVGGACTAPPAVLSARAAPSFPARRRSCPAAVRKAPSFWRMAPHTPVTWVSARSFPASTPRAATGLRPCNRPGTPRARAIPWPVMPAAIPWRNWTGSLPPHLTPTAAKTC